MRISVVVWNEIVFFIGLEKRGKGKMTRWKLKLDKQDKGIQCNDPISIQLDLGGYIIKTGNEMGPIVGIDDLAGILHSLNVSKLEL